MIYLQDDNDKPGVMEDLRTEVCNCAALYALKYEEEFSPYAPSFVTAVWNVLLSTNSKVRFDAVSSWVTYFYSLLVLMLVVI